MPVDPGRRRGDRRRARPPGGTSSGSHAGSTGAASHFQSPRPAHARRLVVERDVAHLRRDGVPEPPVRRWTRNPDRNRNRQIRAHVSGSRRRMTLASASAMNVATVSRHAAALNARPHLPPIRGRPSARQRSSHTIARRSGTPCSSVTTMVPRWVVSATPASASARPSGSPTAAGKPRRPRASRAPRPARSSRAGPGRTARWGPWRGEEVAGRVEHHRPDALRADVERQDPVGAHHRRPRSPVPVREQDAGVHHARRIERADDCLERRHAERALLRGEVRRVVDAHAVVVGDRRALGARSSRTPPA